MSVLLFGIVYSLCNLPKVSSSIMGETFYCSTFEREESICTVEGINNQHLVLHSSRHQAHDSIITSGMCPVEYDSREGRMQLAKECAVQDLMTKFGSDPFDMKRWPQAYTYTFDKASHPHEAADRITNSAGKVYDNVDLLLREPAPPPSFCHTNKYEFVSDSPLLSMNFFFDEDDKIADCSVIEGTLQVPTVNKSSMVLASSTAVTIVGHWSSDINAFVLGADKGSRGYAFFANKMNGEADPSRDSVLVVRWDNLGIILRQRERKQQP